MANKNSMVQVNEKFFTPLQFCFIYFRISTSDSLYIDIRTLPPPTLYGTHLVQGFIDCTLYAQVDHGVGEGPSHVELQR